MSPEKLNMSSKPRKFLTPIAILLAGMSFNLQANDILGNSETATTENKKEYSQVENETLDSNSFILKPSNDDKRMNESNQTQSSHSSHSSHASHRSHYSSSY